MKTVIAEEIQAHPLRMAEPRAEMVVRKMQAQASGDLRWIQPGFFRSQYELHSAGRRVATMRVRGLFRPSATGESADGSWTFEPVGPAPGKIIVRGRDSYRDLAAFDLGLSDHGGVLQLSDDRALFLRSDFWKGRAEFQTLAGEVILRYRYHGVLRPSADVEVLGKGKQMPELPWLLMLGWCLIVGYL
jgi:hypothetical protein